MHATWNAVIKVRLDRFASLSLTSFGMAVSAALVVPFVPVPDARVWPWIAASLAIHVGYRLFLARAYEAGDLAQTYPLARGTAPLVTAFAGMALMSEHPGQTALAGIALLSAGTFLMSLFGGGDLGRLNPRAVAYALGTSLFIAAYSLVDGNGVRLAESAASYAAWHFLFDGIVSMLIGFWARGRRLLSVLADEWPSALLTGALSAGAYFIAMWAMTKTHIATVAALRETSILFAMLISVLFLGEPVRGWRIASAVLILAGVVVLRLA